MGFFRELAKSVAWGATALGVFLIAGFLAWWWIDEGFGGVSDGVCNIAVVPLAGAIVPIALTDEWGEPLTGVTDPDTFSAQIRSAEADWNIQGILVRIDSGGGTPAASEIMMNTLARSPLPSVALIREAGTSGAYLAATGADTIIASPFSDVGSIGVTLSYLDNVEENEQTGRTWNSLASGPYKDSLNPDKPLTEEERAILERDLDIWHTYFVSLVAQNRGMDMDTVATLADGSSMPGALAQEHGLVDSLGDQETAREWFAAELDLAVEDVIFCE